MPVSTNGHTTNSTVPGASVGRPFPCFRCNKQLGFRCTGGLRTSTVTLHPRQSFTCNNCKWFYKNVNYAFAEQDANDALPVGVPAPEVPAVEVPAAKPPEAPKAQDKPAVKKK